MLFSRRKPGAAATIQRKQTWSFFYSIQQYLVLIITGTFLLINVVTSKSMIIRKCFVLQNYYVSYCNLSHETYTNINHVSVICKQIRIVTMKMSVLDENNFKKLSFLFILFTKAKFDKNRVNERSILFLIMSLYLQYL